MTDPRADLPVPVDVDGIVKAKITVHYTSPVDLGSGSTKFSGVAVHIQTPSKTIHVPDSFDFSGMAAQQVDIDILADYPEADEDWTIYLASKSGKYANSLDPASTPSVTVSVSAKPFTGDAPDVLAFHAGTLDQATGSWAPAMRWEPLKSKMLCDWGCLLPSNTINWSSVAIFIHTPAGDLIQATDLLTEDAFTQTDSGLVFYGCIAIEAADIPAVPEEWEFIACSYDRDGKPNHDLDGNPFGPSVPLMTLASQTKPITENGEVNLDAAVGSISISNIHDISAINISSLTGNLDISRVTNIGTINISSFSGSLDFTRIQNLGQFGIQNFEGVLVTQQLADGILNDLNKFAQDFRPITKVATLPTPPGASYPDKTVVLRTSDSTLWKNNAGTWQAVTASDTITGKIADGDILSISAGKLVGQINAANVQNIRVDQLVGTLSATQASSISISTLNGNLDISRVSNIGTLSLSSFSGNLDVSRVSNITTLSISSFNGNLDASRVNNITTLSVSSFQGSLDASRIANLGTISINTFSGTISNLNATTVTLAGQWQDGHIAAVSASKLIAGSVQVGSGGMTFTGSGGIIVGGSGSVNVLVGGLTANSASFKAGGSGWDITSGFIPSISGPSNSYINAGAFKCNGTPGVTATFTFADNYGATHTIVVNGGLITSWTAA